MHKLKNKNFKVICEKFYKVAYAYAKFDFWINSFFSPGNSWREVSPNKLKVQLKTYIRKRN